MMNDIKPADNVKRDHNRDPVTGEPGAHPVGVGVGATGGGAMGAAIGAIGGPIGAVIGAGVGAVVGGLAGKAVAEQIDPSVEDAYWRDNYLARPYVEKGRHYTDYQPAYRYGWETVGRYPERDFAQVEPELQSDWERRHGTTTTALQWPAAKPAVRDAWDRVRQGSKHT